MQQLNKHITYITKANGETEPFDYNKLQNSLEKSGANRDQIEKVIQYVEDELKPGIRAREIYKKAFSKLKRISPAMAAKYKLKQGIKELGPSGYPFEKYVAEILKHQGYEVIVGQIEKGKCVSHEIDIIAQRDDHHFMIECKFHSSDGRKCDVKTPLYVNARFHDIEKMWRRKPGHNVKFHQAWLVTNTRLTLDAIKYGECAGMHLISWDYPKQGSLKQRIEISGLYPITCLTSLTRKEKQELLKNGIVHCKQINTGTNFSSYGIKPGRINRILKEVEQLLVFR